MKQIQAPKFVPDRGTRVFLAGSIEMGAAENWQDRLTALLKETELVVLNPRRDDWDSSWEQKIENEQFREQVEWELQNIEGAEKVVIYFDPNTKAPITLLELGLVAGYKEASDVFVVCPEGFYRKGNVDIVCDRYGIEQFESIEDLAKHLIENV